MLKNLVNLHKSCFPHKPWTADDFSDLKKSGCEIMASENGFIVWRTVMDESEIITIGVHPDARGTGIADAMLELIERDIKSGKIFLEVAKDNTAAQKLYEKHGYKIVGCRPKYYDGIDAIIMEKRL